MRGEVLMNVCFEPERSESRNAEHQLKRVRHVARELLEPDHRIAPTRSAQLGDVHASAHHRAADGDIEHSLLQWSAIEDVCLGFQKFIVPLLLIVLAGVRQGVQNTCLELFKLTERFWVIFAGGGFGHLTTLLDYVKLWSRVGIVHFWAPSRNALLKLILLPSLQLGSLHVEYLAEMKIIVTIAAAEALDLSSLGQRNEVGGIGIRRLQNGRVAVV